MLAQTVEQYRSLLTTSDKIMRVKVSLSKQALTRLIWQSLDMHDAAILEMWQSYVRCESTVTPTINDKSSWNAHLTTPCFTFKLKKKIQHPPFPPFNVDLTFRIAAALMWVMFSLFSSQH